MRVRSAALPIATVCFVLFALSGCNLFEPRCRSDAGLQRVDAMRAGDGALRGVHEHERLPRGQLLLPRRLRRRRAKGALRLLPRPGRRGR